MGLRDALLRQSAVTTELGSPFTGQILRVLAEHLQPGTAIADRLFAWPGDISARAQSVPLRLAGAFHSLVLLGAAPGLVAVYPPNPIPADAALWEAMDTALRDHEAHVQQWLDSPPQTNEVARSAPLIAAGHWLTDRFGLPLCLSELGSSAGLNLMWDRFALTSGETQLGQSDTTVALSPKWRGQQPVASTPSVTDRRGVDLVPLDLSDEQGKLRTLSYIWADQTERLERTRAAIALADAQVDQGDASDWLETRLAHAKPGVCHMLFHTIVWQYFPNTVSNRATALIESAGERATEMSPLAWFAMEGDDRAPGAGMTLRLWPGNLRFDMGRVDFHGRWVDWQPKEIT